MAPDLHNYTEVVGLAGHDLRNYAEVAGLDRQDPRLSIRAFSRSD
jgi:hypothetical protein